MMGRKTLGELQVELEATLSRSDALRSGRGEVPVSLRLLGRESGQPARPAVPDEVDGPTPTTGTTTPVPGPRQGKRSGSRAGGRRRA